MLRNIVRILLYVVVICVLGLVGAYISQKPGGLTSKKQPCGDVCMSYDEFYMLRCGPHKQGFIEGCEGVDGGINE